MKCSMKIRYLTSVECMPQVSKCYRLLSHATKKCQVANFHGQASYAYGCLNGAKYFIFMDNTLKPVSCIEQM
jgi:hypothetical protein